MKYTELPGDLSYNELHFYKEEMERRATFFGLLTAVGIYHGSLYFGDQVVGEEVIFDHQLASYVDAPLSLGVTKFHFILLYHNRVLFINRLNEEVVQKEVFEKSLYGQLRGVCHDVYNNTIWLYSESRVFRVAVEKEDRSVWKVFLSRAIKDGGSGASDFAEAYAHCPDMTHKKVIALAQAEHNFKLKDYENGNIIVLWD